MVWVTSDLHLLHKNIINLCRKQFSSVEEHDKYVIDQYNSVVGKDDLVYILGDLGFTPKDQLITIIKKLNGRKILILGNHDRLKPNEYICAGIIDVINHPIYYNNNIILSHIPVKEAYNNPWCINVHGHIHRGSLDLPNFFNVNIEENDYKPINMEVFQKKAEELCQRYRWQPYETEWYAKFEKHHD